MKINWKLSEIPEMAPLTPRERRVVHLACWQSHWVLSRRGWQGMGIIARCALLAVGPLFWLRFGLGFRFNGYSELYFALGTGLGLFVGLTIHFKRMFSYLRPFYAEYIRLYFPPRKTVEGVPDLTKQLG